jgi:hypothetical protein
VQQAQAMLPGLLPQATFAGAVGAGVGPAHFMVPGWGRAPPSLTVPPEPDSLRNARGVHNPIAVRPDRAPGLLSDLPTAMTPMSVFKALVPGLLFQILVFEPPRVSRLQGSAFFALSALCARAPDL